MSNRKRARGISPTRQDLRNSSERVYSSAQAPARFTELSHNQKRTENLITDTGAHISGMIIEATNADSTLPINSGTDVKIDPGSGPADPGRRTRQGQFLQDFIPHLSQLQDWILDHHVDTEIGTTCDCGARTRNTQCWDCFQYRASCEVCFVRLHLNSPFHWAHVWKEEVGHFVRHDISGLAAPGNFLQLGHHGRQCERSKNLPPHLFTVIHTNGVHETKLRFCTCKGLYQVNKAEQLMRARLFPATIKDPKTAISFEALRENHLNHLQSKTSAYDQSAVLQRRTDNAFTQDVPDIYKNVVRLDRIWAHLSMVRRLGQSHGIDEVLPFRPPGSLRVLCPVCPHGGLNMEDRWWETPDALWKYVKNTDPQDASLSAGSAYIPSDERYNSYLTGINDERQEKSVCNFISAVNKQDRKKFKFLKITGTVQVQCDQAFVLSCVDLQYGERFANTDYAVALALEQFAFSRKDEMESTKAMVASIFTPSQIAQICEKPDIVFSYDSDCAYSIKLPERFRTQLPKFAGVIEKMRHVIPMLHVNNHWDRCMYFFCAAYLTCVGHFHGETAEHEHAELKQLGGQLKQMNHGHRHDSLNDFHGSWNWRKTIMMSATLENEIADAGAQFSEKRDEFSGLSEVHRNDVPRWSIMDKTPVMIGKDVVSVYCHKPNMKLPTLSAIFNSRVNGNSTLPRTSKPILRDVEKSNVEDSTKLPVADLYAQSSDLAVLLKEAFRIQVIQLTVKAVLRKEASHPLASNRKEITSRRTKLSQSISQLRKQQKRIMPQVADYIARHKPSNPEDTNLYLPSSFSASERLKLGLESLAHEEKVMREGEIVDAVLAVRTAAQSLSGMRVRKRESAHGQQQNTSAVLEIETQIKVRDDKVAYYNHVRQQLIQLAGDDPRFPPLKVQDTFRKPTETKRQVGDSRRPDGMVWRISGAAFRAAKLAEQDDEDEDADKAEDNITVDTTREEDSIVKYAGTQGSSRKKGYKKKTPLPVQTQEVNDSERYAEPKTDGWIWTFGSRRGLSEKEMKEWESEGNRVQWFRAQAEMMRWLEQWEIKHAEFERAIRYFTTMKTAWSGVAKRAASQSGHRAYANKQVSMYARMSHECESRYKRVGDARLWDRTKGSDTLADRVAAVRKTELQGLRV